MRIAILGFLLSLGCPPAVTAPTPTTAPLVEGDYAMTVDGMALAYHVHGRGPVCIVHPGGPGLEWSYLRMPEVEHVLTLVYLEPAGTGVSQPLPAPRDYTLARYAQLLDGARGAFGLARVCVLGHGHGGMVAVTWAASYPTHVAGLILYDTVARVDDQTRKEQAAGAAAYAKEPWFAAATAALERSGKVATDEEANAVYRDGAPLLFADWTHRQAELAAWLASVHACANPMRGAGTQQAPWDARAKLAVVHAPALVITGAKDWLAPPPRADELVHAIAGAQLAILPSSGQMGHLEEPVEFAAAIAEFARKL
ncbi:MAG TPA: alpha/beta hydrolase [Kofleriaceae bacterium]|nr:alpha/beta hydrolase [Kofleriaceae bacterium]